MSGAPDPAAGRTPWRFLAIQSRREARALARKGVLFVLCLATGVAAVVAVAGLADGIERGLRARSREMLAADVVVRGRAAIPEGVVAAAREIPGARTADVTQVFSMIAAETADGPRNSRLADVKGVGEGWPFHGTLRLDPPRRLHELLDDESALIAPALARRLGIGTGDRVRLGDRSFRVAGFVLSEPDEAVGRIALAPRVLVTPGGLEAAGLLGAGSRKAHALLVAVPDGTEGAAKDALVAALGGSPYYEVESHRDAQPDLRRDVERAERFLGLVALLSLVIGGAGIAQAARAWLGSRIEGIALLRCAGLRPRDVLLLYVGLALGLGLIGSLLGLAAGTAAVSAAPALLKELAEGVDVRPWQPLAMARGLGLGLLTALAFSVPTLLEVLRVPPLRALRTSVEPPPPGRASRVIIGGALLGFGFAAAWVQAGTAVLGALFTGALVLTAVLLALAAFGLSRGVGRAVPREGRAWLRLAVGAAGRPGSGVLAATVALGLGVLVVMSVVLVQLGLRQELMARLPEGAPSAFLLDVQPEQWPGVRELLEEGGATQVDSTPLVNARLSSIDGRPVTEIAAEREGGRDKWALTREQRLTWWRDPPEGNAIVAGTPWSLPDEAELSVEEEFARDLGLSVGSRVELDVQGVPVSFVVSSLRRVEWRTFRINFFLVAEPGSLDGAPHQVLAAARLPEGREGPLQDELVALAPNVTLIPIREALQRAEQFVRRLAAGVQAVGAFTVVAGVAILAGSVLATAARRGAQVALLRTLGMTRRELAAMLALQHGLVGLVAGVIGCAGALLLSWIVLARVMELPWHARPMVVLTALVVTAVLTAASGVLASWSALQSRPVEALRREG